MPAAKDDLLSVMAAQWEVMKADLAALKAEVRAMSLQGRSEVTGSFQTFPTYADLPSPGQPGRVAFDQQHKMAYLDTGVIWTALVQGALLASGSYVSVSTLDLTVNAFTPFDSTNLKFTVIAPSAVLEVNWRFTALRSASGLGYVDIGYDDGAGGYVRFGDTTVGMSPLHPDDRISIHLTAFFNVTPGQSYTFYLLGGNGSVAYPLRIPANNFIQFWAVAR